MSKEVAMLPQNFRSGPFSKCGDFGSIIINSIGRVAGMLTGSTGITDSSDCMYGAGYLITTTFLQMKTGAALITLGLF